jgi:chaperonin GroES
MRLPASQQRPLNSGTVIAVGPGKRSPHTGELIPIDLEPGDVVDFFDFANTVEIDGEEYLLLRDEEIWQKGSAAAQPSPTKGAAAPSRE